MPHFFTLEDKTITRHPQKAVDRDSFKEKAVTIRLEGDGTLRGQADGREVLTGCPPVGRCDGRDLLIVFEKSVLWKPTSSLNQSSVGFSLPATGILALSI